MWSLQVNNIVAKIKFKPIKLKDLLHIPGLRYNPARFSAAFFKLSSGFCNIFSSGTVAFLGLKTMEALTFAIEEFMLCFYDVIDVLDSRPEVCNIAASILPPDNMTFAPSQVLSALRSHEAASVMKVIYEPDLHNAIHVQFRSPLRGVAILHPTCKGFLTGAKSQVELSAMLKQLSDRIDAINP